MQSLYEKLLWIHIFNNQMSSCLECKIYETSSYIDKIWQKVMQCLEINFCLRVFYSALGLGLDNLGSFLA